MMLIRVHSLLIPRSHIDRRFRVGYAVDSQRGALIVEEEMGADYEHTHLPIDGIDTMCDVTGYRIKFLQ